ncbi:hypothetical protein P7K49_004281 [Saguinus oedipus]|uniref:Uncharacterized protein n=1 Tax=Saguinus oedipus TaxID=9490 RepID=A0ABQ9W6Z4_SAGOE|nr:hypothetical protein P7K49_004281 [Saguinus oedipus]
MAATASPSRDLCRHLSRPQRAGPRGPQRGCPDATPLRGGSGGPGNMAAGPGNMAAGPGNMAAGPGNMAAGPGNMAAGPGNMAAGPGNVAAARGLRGGAVRSRGAWEGGLRTQAGSAASLGHGAVQIRVPRDRSVPTGRDLPSPDSGQRPSRPGR